MKQPRLLAALACVGIALTTEARAAIDGARAFAHVLELAGSIGPRKTGSDADRRAVEYVRREMEAAGLEVSVQEVTALRDEDGERAAGSWNVLGRIAGRTPDTIVVAAHHDSHGVLVPGANDDASGLAVLLEVARAVTARPRETGYLFASFGGEEEGLLGSRSFVAGADLSRVRAVVALELLGRGDLVVGPAPQPPPLWAQRALLRAARESGVRRVVARPLWALVPRFVDLPFTADHEPFLEKGVPAFLLMGTFPAWTYHTSEDSVLRVRPEALGRAASVLDRLLEDLEQAPPPRSDDPHYLPLSLFGWGLVVPSRGLWGIALAALAGAILLALGRLRALRSPRAVGEMLRVCIVAGASTAIGLSGLFASEELMERIHGVRHPWAAHQRLHVAQAVACALVTGWLGLKLFRRIKPTIDPGPYFAVALLLPLAGVAAFLWLGWPEPAAMAAVPVVAFLLSRFVQSTARKLALGLAGAVPFLVVLSLDDYRTAVEVAGLSVPGWALFTALFAVGFPLVVFLAHVASFQDCLHSPVWRWLSGGRVGGGLLAIALVLIGVNAALPPYNLGHRQVVQVRQRIDLHVGRAAATVQSSDSLRGIRLQGLGGRALMDDGTIATIDLPPPGGRVVFEATAETADEAGGISVTCATRLAAPRTTDRISYLFASRSGFRVPGRDTALRHRYTFTRVAPLANPAESFRLLLPPGGDLALALRAEFQEDLLGLEPEGGPRVFVHHGTIVASRTLVGPAPAAIPAPAASPASAAAPAPAAGEPR